MKYLSLIVPFFNSHEKTLKLLESLLKSENAPSYEVILVDVGSKQGFKYENQKLAIRIIRLEKNKGPGFARNVGAEVAQGEFLVFLDSDVELFPDTLCNLANVLRENSETVAVTGTWVKDQCSKAFFPNFKALRDFSYWNNERNKKSSYVTFSPRIGAIKRSLFLSLGGFNEFSKLEDFDLTYRVAQTHPIAFVDTVRVKHEFEGFWAIAKKYFIRSDYWIRLFERRRKFDPVGSTFKEGLATLSGVGVVLSGLFSFFWHTPTFYLFVALFLSHILLLHKFLLFANREKGIMFAVKSLLTGLALYCFIFAGVFWGKMRPKKEALSYE